MSHVIDMHAASTGSDDDGRGAAESRETTKRKPIVVRGRVEALANVPFHRDGPLTRWLMASAALDPALDCHIAIHQFSDVPSADRSYCDLHVHSYDEVNVFHSTADAGLCVAVCLGDETLQIEAPATVYIPAGTPHAANVTSGTGIMIAILMDGQFRAVSGAK